MFIKKQQNCWTKEKYLEIVLERKMCSEFKNNFKKEYWHVPSREIIDVVYIHTPKISGGSKA